MALSGLTIDGVSVGRTNNLALGNIAYGVEELFGHGDGVGMIELDATERCCVVVSWCRREGGYYGRDGFRRAEMGNRKVQKKL